MSVVLVYPPNYFKEGKLWKKPYGGLKDRCGRKVPPLGILYLASSMLEGGMKVDVIDLNLLNIGLKKSVDLIGKSKPQVVGISAASFQLRGAVQLAERLKERFDVVIGLGGAHISVDPDFINRFPIFDFGLVGEGEITFPSLVTRILKGEKVKGIFYGKQSKSLDELPFPARQLIDTKKYFSQEKQECATILATRGCPYNCIFCSIKGLGGQRVRVRSPRNVVDEMEGIRGRGTRCFVFVDDTFTVNRKFTLKLCEEIIDRKLDVDWWCETRIDSVDETTLKVMRKAGCRQIAFGIESGSERIRINIIRKNFTNDQVIRVFNLCKKLGIFTEAYFMLGFPTETMEDLYHTLNFSAKLGAGITDFHLTQIYPGSDLFELAVKEGKISPNVYDQYAKGRLKGSLPVYVPEGLSLHTLLQLQGSLYPKSYQKRNY